MKPIPSICLLLAGLLLIGLVGCAGSGQPKETESFSNAPTGEPTGTSPADPEPEKPDDTVNPPADDWKQYETTVSLNSRTEGIRILGKRNLESTSQLNSDWTCSGLEFVLDIKGGDLTLRTSTTNPTYFRVWVDGEAWKNPGGSLYYMVNGTKNMVISGIPAGEHTVRVIKVTGYTLSQAHFYSMTFYGSLLKEKVSADKDLYIEFVGDSICCGWGTIGDHKGEYSDQDGALAYPYLVSEAMHADYSVTALSGQGLLMGKPGMTNGYLYGSPLRDSETEYKFARKADIVVVNIGTNDYGYQSQYGITENAFRDAYRAFIQTVARKNGNCKIYCLYNTMNDTFANAILEVCEELGGEAAGIYTFKMDRTASGHPTIAEQAAYANKLTAYLTETKDNEVTQPIVPAVGTLSPVSIGVGIEISYDDEDWNR